MESLSVKYGNPKGLYDSKFYSQVVTVSGKGKTVYIGGQNAINAEGKLVGQDNFELQTKQALENIKIALASENATFDNVIKLNIYMVEGCDPAVGFKAFRETVGVLKNPPLITVLKVAGLANPLFLIEIDAIAVTEDKEDSIE
ncbi:MAG: RidA family protein [Clostridiaceae bacterium]|jgi:enamine deaminase RidA (YjgF/YER057c/UK114 family)|nr:RidA family protein [Clostridiaceae bacterium]